jgi:hypothetical protein
VKGLNPEHWGAQASRHYHALESVDGTLMNNVVFCSTGPESLNEQLLGQVAFVIRECLGFQKGCRVHIPYIM